MKKAFYVTISICLLIVLSLLAKESVERAKRKSLDEHENRVESIKKWTGPSNLREKSEVLLPEIEGSKKDMSAAVMKDDLRKVDGIVKTSSKSKTMKLQKIQIYNPAFEMVKVEDLQKSARHEISKEEKKIKLAGKAISKGESRRKIEQFKDEFYLDFLNLKLKNAKIAGNQEEINDVKSAIQKYEQYLNANKKSKE